MDSTEVVASLKACVKQKDLLQGTTLHAKLLKTGLLQSCSDVANTLVSMYAKCGALAKAQEVLEELPVRNTISWNALIAGYIQHRQEAAALECFDRMQRDGLSPSAVTFTSLLKACGMTGSIDKGALIHAEINKQGLLEKDVVLGNALVDMYAKCGALAKAHRVLDELPLRKVVSWSALIGGYAQQGHGREALLCYERMQSEGFMPDAVTFNLALKACGIMGATEDGEKVHAEIVRFGLLPKNVVLSTALVDMYAKCGELEKAQLVFEELSVRNEVSWGALITGYAQHGQDKESVNCFEAMKIEGHAPNAAIFIIALKACGSIAAYEHGKLLHTEIVRQGLLQKDLVLGTSLVDLYAKCGAVAEAHSVLEGLSVRDVVSWSALIAGYGHEGHSEKVLQCFEQMQSEGLFPDPVTVAGVLNACRHTGFLDEGQMYFEKMNAKFSSRLGAQCHTCMADLFSRADNCLKALGAFEKLPSAHIPTVWYAFLGACQRWENLRLARLAFAQAIQVDRNILQHMLVWKTYVSW